MSGGLRGAGSLSVQTGGSGEPAQCLVALVMPGARRVRDPRRADRDSQRMRRISKKIFATPAVCIDQVHRRISALGLSPLSG